MFVTKKAQRTQTSLWFWTRLSLFTQTLTCTLVERLFTLNRLHILTTSTGTVELRFLKRGCPWSDSIVSDLYHNGPLREQFLPQITSAIYALDRTSPTMSEVRDTPITNNQGRLVQSWINITQGLCKFWTQIWQLKKPIQLNSLCIQFDDWMCSKNRENYPSEWIC